MKFEELTSIIAAIATLLAVGKSIKNIINYKKQVSYDFRNISLRIIDFIDSIFNIGKYFIINVAIIGIIFLLKQSGIYKYKLNGVYFVLVIIYFIIFSICAKKYEKTKKEDPDDKKLNIQIKKFNRWLLLLVELVLVWGIDSYVGITINQQVVNGYILTILSLLLIILYFPIYITIDKNYMKKYTYRVFTKAGETFECQYLCENKSKYILMNACVDDDNKCSEEILEINKDLIDSISTKIENIKIVS